ncbi:hypothetical protein ACFLW9_03135 [Chloroflexota bacterium]
MSLVGSTPMRSRQKMLTTLFKYCRQELFSRTIELYRRYLTYLKT